MISKTKILVLILLCFFYILGNSQTKDCKISFVVQNKKTTYICNDTIIILVKVQLDKDFCDEAGDVTKIFCKGLKIKKRLKWIRISQTTLVQKLVLIVLDRKDKGTLTAYRKTGHYNCLQQIEFKFKNSSAK